MKINQFAVFAGYILLSVASFAEDAGPKWFSKDFKSAVDWGFFCTGTGKNEDEALSVARAQCSSKMCLLFGVEVEYENTAVETLKDTTLNSKVIERCPKVRVVGRIEKRKSVECEEGNCRSFVEQRYPKEEYDKEYARLNSPSISKEFEKTIVIRENDKVFKDPGDCKNRLADFSLVRGERPVDVERRIRALEQAKSVCVELDYRDAPLQSELGSYFVKSLSSRDTSAAIILARILGAKSRVEDKVEAFIGYEKEALASEKFVQPLVKWIEGNFDHLAYRQNFDPTTGEWILVNSSRSKVNPYLEEFKSCVHWAGLLLRWPKNFGRNLSVCVDRPSTEVGKDCQAFNRDSIKMQYSGCVCMAAGVDDKQICVSGLSQYIDESCPQEFGKKCLQGMSELVTERFKMQAN